MRCFVGCRAVPSSSLINPIECHLNARLVDRLIMLLLTQQVREEIGGPDETNENGRLRGLQSDEKVLGGRLYPPGDAAVQLVVAPEDACGEQQRQQRCE